MVAAVSSWNFTKTKSTRVYKFHLSVKIRNRSLVSSMHTQVPPSTQASWLLPPPLQHAQTSLFLLSPQSWVLIGHMKERLCGQILHVGM